MASSRLLLLISALMIAPIFAQAESNYWSHIQELVKFDTPKGNPRLEAYLKGLKPDEMLQAAREYSEYAQKKIPEDNWAVASFNVGLALGFYEPVEGGLTDEKLDILLKCITDENEGRFFRESLARLVRDRYWPRLTESQRKKARQTFLSVLLNKKVPVRLRALTCRELGLVLSENYQNIILSDKNVQPLRNDKEKWRNLNDLVRKGEVQLDPETRKSLKAIRDEIETITPTLSTLSNDANESPEVKDRAQKALKSLGELPDVSEK